MFKALFPPAKTSSFAPGKSRGGAAGKKNASSKPPPKTPPRDAEDARHDASPPPLAPAAPHHRASRDSRGGKTQLCAAAAAAANTPKLPPDACALDRFDVGRVLGTGSFGRVSFAKHKPTGALVAIKVLSKSEVIRTRQVEHVRAEAKILRDASHPFIVNFLGSSQDEASLHFVLEYVVGGEFFTHLRCAGRFSDDASRFYASEIVLALEYLHGRGVAYRDLKPENLLVDAHGHLKITDFGFAKEIGDDGRTYTLCGTPDYLAPEIIKNKGHGFAVDWWALGVIVFEMLAGYPPFYGEDPMETYRKILEQPAEFPAHFTKHARDIIRKMLQKDVSKRIGNLKNGVRDITSHAWFASVDWRATLKKKTTPPMRPRVRSADDTSNFDDYGDAPITTRDAFELTPEEQELFVDI